MATRKIKTPGEAAQEPEDTTAAAPDTAEAVQAVESDLPLLADIDPTKLTRAVLTQGGWVCPA